MLGQEPDPSPLPSSSVRRDRIGGIVLRSDDIVAARSLAQIEHLNPQVPFLVPLHQRVETSRRIEGILPEQDHGRASEDVLLQDAPLDAGAEDVRSRFGFHEIRSAYQAYPFGEQGELALQLSRGPFVVIVEERYESVIAQRCAGIASGSSRSFATDGDGGDVSMGHGYFLPGEHDDDPLRPDGLGKNAPVRPGERLGPVVGEDYDGDSRPRRQRVLGIVCYAIPFSSSWCTRRLLLRRL